MTRNLFFLPAMPLLIAAMLAPGCSDDTDKPDGSDAAGVTDAGADGSVGEDTGEPVDPGSATFKVRGSVEQLFVTHATADLKLEAHNGDDEVVASGVTDHLGSLIFRKLKPGKGYRVHVTDASPATWSGPVQVWGVQESKPSQSFYDEQKIEAGNGYLTTRDGTTLAYFATMPGPAKDGPYPTIVNYSGYDPGRPGSQVVPDDLKTYCAVVPVLCNAPSDASAMIAAVNGYATVSVNMRGTGCSGGAYDYFETLQLLDGYDIIETVAAQPWVAHHKVGMTGLSYPGISQLFVAKTQPPGLAAITPLSVIGNSATTLVPGGILNDGFALNWINHVYKRAAPYGQGWEQAQVDAGDTICEENQLLHDQRVNNVEQAKDSKYYEPEIIDPLNPTRFVDKIKVPVFLAGAWQDEQTGPFFTTLLDKFTSAPNRRFMLYNGVHSDGFAPQVLVEWKAFLDIWVARKKPTMGSVLGLLMPQVTNNIYGVSLEMPPDRWKDVGSYEAARDKWEAEQEVRVFFANGAKKPLGAPQGNFDLGYSQWPPKETELQRWYFQPDGGLAADLPEEATLASTFKLDPKAGGRGILAKGAKLWSALPKYNWKVPGPGFEVAFITEPLSEDHVMLGTGSVDFWIRSPDEVNDADIEVNLSEVLADGNERYVQSGWLRASFRSLTPDSTDLWPEPSLLKTDIKPLTPGAWQKVRVAIAGFGHAFRKGSRIRLAIDTPGDSRADWRFALLSWGKKVSYDVAHSPKYPSSVALPLLKGATIPADASTPPCDSLRGQPCRPLGKQKNVPAAP